MRLLTKRGLPGRFISASDSSCIYLWKSCLERFEENICSVRYQGEVAESVQPKCTILKNLILKNGGALNQTTKDPTKDQDVEAAQNLLTLPQAPLDSSFSEYKHLTHQLFARDD